MVKRLALLAALIPRAAILSRLSTHFCARNGPVMKSARSALSSGRPSFSSRGSRGARVSTAGISIFEPAMSEGFFFSIARASSDGV